MAKNRNIAMKHDKAKGQRAAAFQDVLMKEAMNATPMSDQTALICMIASRQDTASIGGRRIRVVPQGVNGQNVAKRAPDLAKPAIIAMHF